MTEARRRANAIRNWRHGLRSRSGITAREVLRVRLQRKVPGAAEIIDAYVAAASGDMNATDALAAKAMAEAAIMRQLTAEDVLRRGVIAEEPMVSKEGEILGSRVKAHPGLSALRHFHEQLGFTAEALQITRKSALQDREAIEQRERERRELKRRARLVEFIKNNPKRLPLPPPPDSENIEEEHWLLEPTSGEGSPN